MKASKPTSSNRHFNSKVRSRTRHVTGLQLHVEEAGPAEGPLLILLHGFPGFWWDWRHQIEALAALGYHVLIPDMRGYNLSDKPQGIEAYHLDTLAADIIALAESYGHSTFGLVGHDWGGVVAWWAAACFPQFIERLAILNAPHPDVWRRLIRRRPIQVLRSSYVAFFQLPLVPEALLKVGHFALLRRALTGTSRPEAFTGQDIERYIEAWARPGALSAMLNYYRALRLRRWSRPRRVRPATLVIWGARDVFLERQMALASLKLCEQGEILFLEEATHWAHLEEVEVVNAALAGFFQREHEIQTTDPSSGSAP
jgi:pimeloyl-ACP methyl ester carboxylesterase